MPYLKSDLEDEQLGLSLPGSADHVKRGILQPTLERLEQVMAETYWEDRLAPEASHPDIPPEVRCTIDSFPIFARGHACPKKIMKLLFNGKYKHAIWKVTCFFSITGQVLACRIDYGNTPDDECALKLIESLKARYGDQILVRQSSPWQPSNGWGGSWKVTDDLCTPIRGRTPKDLKFILTQAGLGVRRPESPRPGGVYF